jgi:aryl-alcohol dehydrogenase-like predicted oxidoreductase
MTLTVVIDNSDILVSRLGYGTASLHHLFRTSARLALLQTAFDAGITHFDASPYYGYSLAELDLGRFLREHSRDAVTVATKVGLYPWGPASSHALGVWCRKAAGRIYRRVSLPEMNWSLSRAQRSLQASLQRLGTDYVDFLFLHEPVPELIQADEFLGWLESLRSRGVIRAWGVAGLATHVAPLVVSGSPLACVVQTRDTLQGREADFLLKQGRSLQFTYGYLSGQKQHSHLNFEETLLQATHRNPNGCVLFSSRKAERIRQIGSLAV